MGKIVILDHPLIQHKLSLIRDKATGVKEFREAIGEIAMLMCYEATRDLPLKEVEMERREPLTKQKEFSGKKSPLFRFLGAGLALVAGVLTLIRPERIGLTVFYADRKP